MTLRSALQDLRETTLSVVSGLLAQLAYLGSLRRSEGGYYHWGLSLVHGEEASNRALKAAHAEVLSKVLRSPISSLEEELHQMDPAGESLVNRMQTQVTDLLLLPEDQAARRHISSVLLALSSLQKSRSEKIRPEKNRKPATPSTS
jgi:hypothetical protein